MFRTGREVEYPRLGYSSLLEEREEPNTYIMYRLNNSNKSHLVSYNELYFTMVYEYAVEIFQSPWNDVASDFSFSINIIHQDSSGSVNIFVASQNSR